MSPDRIKVGLLIDGFFVPAWIHETIKRIRESDYVTISLIVKRQMELPVKTHQKKPGDNFNFLVYNLYRKLENKYVKLNPNAFSQKNISDLIINVPVLNIQPVEEGNFDRIRENDLHLIDAYQLDVCIKFGFQNLKGCVLTMPKFGVWEFGENLINHKASLAGVREVMQGCCETAVSLRLLSEKCEEGYILYESFSSTNTSINKNQNIACWKAVSFIPRKLKELYETNGNCFEKIKEKQIVASGWGGAQVFCIQLYNELATYPDYEVTLVSLYDHQSNHMSTDLIDKRVRFVTLGKKKGFDIKIFKSVYKLLQEIKPNVAHTHLHSGYYATWAYLMMNNPSMRKIHTFHSLVTKDAPWHGRLIYKYFFQRDIIHPVSISEEVFKGAVKEYGECIKTLIHNGSVAVQPSPKFQSVTDTINSFKKNRETKVFINVARIDKVKNQQLIIDTMKILEAESENAIALIVGGYIPEDKELYDQLVQNKPGNVHFVGRVDNVGDYLLNADAFLLSSLYEGLPISLLEAMSAGAVPVCTPVGSLVNIIKPDIGFLSKDFSTESYLAALKAFLNTDAATIERLKANGKCLYQKEFSIKSCAAKYDKLYQSSTVH